MKIEPNVLYDKIERYGTSGLLPDTVDAILAIIEKQIPKTANADDNGGYPEYFEKWIECSVCGEPIPEYVEDDETECHCLRCGQKLMWVKE